MSAAQVVDWKRARSTRPAASVQTPRHTSRPSAAALARRGAPSSRAPWVAPSTRALTVGEVAVSITPEVWPRTGVGASGSAPPPTFSAPKLDQARAVGVEGAAYGNPPLA